LTGSAIFTSSISHPPTAITARAELPQDRFRDSCDDIRSTVRAHYSIFMILMFYIARHMPYIVYYNSMRYELIAVFLVTITIQIGNSLPV
jgi:hypothetical protein